MDVTLTDPINISISSAKLVVEDSGTGTIEFTVLGQPVRLNIDSTSYTYDIDIAIDDRVQLIEAFGALAIGSKGIVQEIVPDYTEDKIKVLFDEIFPDQILDPAETHVVTTIPTVFIELPLSIVEKI
jgi:hypothetical protein